MEWITRVVQCKLIFRVLLFVIYCLLFSPAGAHNRVQNIADLFKVMPDSLMPYLTNNNRLDMIDFMEAKMKAEVTNLLEGKSEMTMLSDDSLCIRVSDVLQVKLMLVERDDSVVVSMQKNYQISEHQVEKTVQYFSSTWCPLSLPEVVYSTLLKRDEELLHF